MFTLKAYGDESADETKSRVFVVGAVFGTDNEWSRAMLEWFRITKGQKVHCTDLESAHDRNTEEHNHDLALYKALTICLAESHLVGMTVALNLASLEKYLPDTPRETAYCKCFTDILRNLGTMAKRQEGDLRDSQIEFTFDSRRETDGTAGVIYDTFRNLPEWHDTKIFNTKVMFEGGDEPRLEIADLLAREAMKELDRKITGRAKRRSYEALEATKKFIFIEYGDEYCQQWRDKVNSPQGQGDRKELEKWYVDNGCVQNGHVHDTQANRVRFYGWLEAKEALLKKTL